MSTRTAVPQITGHRHVRLISDEGGYGDIHLYEETALGRNVAVKVIREADLSPAAVTRFLAEAGAMAMLEHPNIVRVHGSGRTADGRPYIAMQYCPKPTLEQRAATERLGVAEVVRAGVGIGSALETAHRAGLLHRDVKPANILTTPWDAPGLTDFGVAARIAGADPAAADEVGVSVPWSPPEMLFTDTQGSPASDVYSLAATLWHLLVGRPPFAVPQGDNSRMAMMARIRELPVPATGRPDVPEMLERLFRHAMAKEPGQRPRTMAELVHGLQAVEAHLRLPPTDAVYVDAAPAHALADHGGAAWQRADDEPATRRRPNRAGEPQPVAAPDDAASTRLRARSTQVDVPPGADPAPTKVSRRVLTAAGVAAVVVAAAGGWWLVGRGGEDRPAPGPTSSASVPAGPGEDVLPPGAVTVTGVRRGGSATFTWEYSAALPTDTFRWEVVGGRGGVLRRPSVTVPATAGTRVCVHVIVVRADGSFATREWSAPGCVT